MRAPFLHLCTSFLVISQWKLHLFKKQTGGRLRRNCFWFWFSVKVLSSLPFSLLYSYTCCYILKTPVRLLLSLDIQYSFPRLCSLLPSSPCLSICFVISFFKAQLGCHLLSSSPALSSSGGTMSLPLMHHTYHHCTFWVVVASHAHVTTSLSRRTLQGQGSSLSPTLPPGLVEFQAQRGAQKHWWNKIELVVLDVVPECCEHYCLWCKHNSFKV